jgi:hypothetical protein
MLPSELAKYNPSTIQERIFDSEQTKLNPIVRGIEIGQTRPCSAHVRIAATVGLLCLMAQQSEKQW